MYIHSYRSCRIITARLKHARELAPLHCDEVCWQSGSENRVNWGTAKNYVTLTARLLSNSKLPQYEDILPRDIICASQWSRHTVMLGFRFNVLFILSEG